MPEQRGATEDPWRVVSDAHALTIFRGLSSGEGRAYTAVTFPRDPRSGCARMINVGRAVGWLEPVSADEPYGVLDVLNEDGDIVQDFAIPTAQAFQRLKKRLNLRVETDA